MKMIIIIFKNINLYYLLLLLLFDSEQYLIKNIKIYTFLTN